MVKVLDTLMIENTETNASLSMNKKENLDIMMHISHKNELFFKMLIGRRVYTMQKN